MNKHRFSLRAAALLLGSALLLAAAALLSFQLAAEHRVQGRLPTITEELTALLTDRTAGFSGIQSDSKMPSVELENESVCGLLECGNTILPVFAEFDRQNAARRPAVYSGSAYDGSLVLGGNAESLGFLQTLAGGESVTFTDLLGRSFAYRVDSIRHAEKLFDGLAAESAELTLFVRMNGAYLIVRCTEGASGT
jgi:sortase A